MSSSSSLKNPGKVLRSGSCNGLWHRSSVVSSILLIFLAPVFCLTKPYDMGFCLILHQNRAYDMGIPQVLAI
jgi:hypothetical protein